MGPGSLFTSLVTNLLVHGIPEAIAASDAVKVFICNLMTQANESLGLSASEHLQALNAHAGRNLFDFALLNRAPISAELQAKYALEGASQIACDSEVIEQMGIRVIEGDYLEEAGVARHATDRVARDLLRFGANFPSQGQNHARTTASIR